MNYKKTLIVASSILIVGAGASFIISKQKNGSPITSVAQAVSEMDATYIIDGIPVKLTHGISIVSIASESATKVTTKYFGNEAIGDLNGDALADKAFLLTVDAGGSGTFYYIVAAIATKGGYTGTDAILLGDRIAPQTTSITDRIITVNFAERKLSDPMSQQPSIGVSRRFSVNNSSPYTLQEESNPDQAK